VFSPQNFLDVTARSAQKPTEALSIDDRGFNDVTPGAACRSVQKCDAVGRRDAGAPSDTREVASHLPQQQAGL
jgi:hypothetical protein